MPSQSAQVAVDLFHVVHLAVMVRLKIVEAAGFRNIEPAWHTGSATRHLCWAAGRSGAFVPAALAALACMAAIAGDESTAAAAVGEARAELGGRRSWKSGAATC